MVRMLTDQIDQQITTKASNAFLGERAREVSNVTMAIFWVLTIAPELMSRYDKCAAARKRQRRRVRSPPRCCRFMRSRKDTRCYCLLGSGISALVLPRQDSTQGSEAQCTVLGGGVIPGLVVQVLRFSTEEHHAVATEGASPLTPLA